MKRDMSNELANNILPKVPKKEDIPAAAGGPEPQEPPQDPTVQILQLPDESNVEVVLEEIDDAPIDPMLENFLSQFDNPPQPANQPALGSAQAPVPQPLQQLQNLPGNAQNLQMNVNNVQNINPAHFLPNMLFPNINVTINTILENNSLQTPTFQEHLKVMLSL